MALADYQQLVDSLVRDASGTLTPIDRDRAIELARLRYSADAERTLTQDVTWTAAGHFGPMPAGWVAGAYLLGAEYPIGEQPPASIEMSVYLQPGPAENLMTPDALAAGTVVRVTFAAPHQLTGSPTAADTIPARHMEAVASYAAHVLCKQLATHYSGERETSINADASNTESRARNYAARAKDYRAAYYAGIGKADPQGAGGNGGAGGGSSSEPAASVSSWAGRQRNVIRTNDVGMY